MHAVLTEEQQSLQSTVRRIAGRVGVGTPADLGRVDRAQAWRALAETGLLAMRNRDADAKPLASGVETMLVAEGLSGALAPLPFMATILAAELLALGRAPRLWSEQIAEGTVRYGLLLGRNLSELAHIDDLDDAVGVDVDQADYGLALGGPRSAPHIARVALGKAFSGVPGADLTRVMVRKGKAIASTEIEILDEPHSRDALDRSITLALTLACADTVGILKSGLRQAVEYSKTRVQYGVPIGSFQAVQHMCAEMLVRTEAAASMTHYAAWAVDALPSSEGLLAARTAKAYCAPAGQWVAETVMQAFGGIGQTWAHVGHLM